MMWSCLTCAYLYEVQNRTEADSSTCPKCGNYQATGVSFARDIAEGQWNPAKGFFFGSPIGKGIAKAVLVILLIIAVRTILGNKLGMGDASERFIIFTFGVGASTALSSWLDALDKLNSKGGYWFCALFYGVIAMGVATQKGILWGIFWFVCVYWDGLMLLIETVRHNV